MSRFEDGAGVARSTIDARPAPRPTGGVVGVRSRLGVGSALGGRHVRAAVAAAVAAATLAQQPALAALTHRYSFNDGTATDLIGGANGTLVNGATVSDGQLRLVNGGNDVTTGQYLDLPNNIAKTQNVTIEGWTTWGGDANWQRIFDFGTNTAGEQTPGSTTTGYNGSSYFFASPRVDRNGNVFGSEIKVGDPNAVADHIGGTDLGIGTQHHFALVIAGGTGMTLYKDGVSVGSTTTTLNPAQIDQVNTWVGRSNWAADPFYNGFVNEFRVYDSAQTALQVAQEFNAGPDALPGATITNKWAVAGPSDYNVGTNWQLGTVPAAGDVALFDNGGTAVVSADTNALVALQLANGQVRVDGSGSTVTYAPASIDLRPGSAAGASATLAAVNGGVVAVGTLTLDGAATSTGTAAKTINLDNGTLRATGGFSAVGTNFTLNLGAGGGTIDTNGSNVTLGAAVTGSGTLTKAGGGTLTYVYPAGNTKDLTATNNLTLNGGGLAVDTNGQSVTWANGLQGNGGSLTKVGAGTLTLQAANSNLTNLFANGGDLVLDGPNAVTSTSNYSSFGTNGGDVGRLTVRNGAQLTVNGDFNVSDLSGSTGTLVISGANTAVTASTVYVGKNGSAAGVINQSGGTFSRTAGGGDWRIGGPFNTTNDAASVGVWDMSGNAVMTTDSNLQIGAFARGIMTISGTASATSNGYPGVGRFPGSFGVLTVNGGSFTQGGTGQFLLVGEEGTGVLNVSGTGVVNVNNPDPATGLRLGHNKSSDAAAATGIANLGTGGTINAAAVTRNANSAGTVGVLNFHGGTLRPTAANDNFVRDLTGAYVWPEGGRIDTTNGDVTISQPLLAPTGQGVVTIPVTNGGTGYQGTPLVQVTGPDGLAATAVANLTNGVVTSVTVTNPGTDYATAPTVAVFGGNPTTPATLGTATLGANQSGGLTKVGTGTLTLTGANSYTGTTTVTTGTLLVNGPLAGGAAAATGGTLGGTGSIAGPLVVTDGRLAPGSNGVGRLSIGGNVSLAAAATTLIELGGTSAGSLYDQLGVGSGASVTLGGALAVALVNGYAPTVGDTYLILDKQGAGAVSGTFAGLPQGGIVTASGLPFAISYTGGDGNDVTLTAAAVPEPGTASLLGLAAVGLLARRRRCRGE